MRNKCSSCDSDAVYLLTSPANVWELACQEHENEYARTFGEDMLNEWDLPLNEESINQIIVFLNKREQRFLELSILRMESPDKP